MKMSDPAEKYRDKVSPEHRIAMQAIGLAAHLMDQHRPHYEALIKSEQHMHDVGGLLDPTLYRDMLYSDSFKLQTRLIKAAIVFLKEVQEVEKSLKR